MELCLRTALWMFALMGYLQAKPVCVEQGDFGFCDLYQEVTCENVTFTSPTNMEKKCHYAVLECFKKGLTHAEVNCQGDTMLINYTLAALEMLPAMENSSECKLETKESQFENFVDEIRTFVQTFKSSN